MKRTPIASSNLDSVGYDFESLVLEIQFKDQSIYRYFLVPESIYEGLRSAPSAGKFVQQELTSGRFLYKKIR